jgi:hypothetical protein
MRTSFDNTNMAGTPFVPEEIGEYSRNKRAAQATWAPKMMT